MINIHENISRFISPLFFKTIGLDIFGRYKWIQKTLEWTEKERSEWRLKRLGDILEFAWNHVSFYREYWGDHGIIFKRPTSFEELDAYPILTKKIYKENENRFQPDILNMIRYQNKFTGGTTGEPVQYLQDIEQWVLTQAFLLWCWSLAGYKFGDSVGVIAGGSLVPEKITAEIKLRNYFERKLFLFGVYMDEKLAKEYYEKLNAYKVQYLYGYPSIIYLFAQFLGKQKLKLPHIKAVITTAEMLHRNYRNTIESVLSCKVFNDLGCNDGGYEAFECHLHNGFHYNDLQ